MITSAPAPAKHLAEIRQLLFDGKIKEAEALTRETFLSDPVRQKAYQPFGDLRLHFTGQDNATNYRRELDLDSAIARVTCRADGVTYQREAFASHPTRPSSCASPPTNPAHISFTFKMDSPHTNSQTPGHRPRHAPVTGQVETDGLRFESQVRVVATGGQPPRMAMSSRSKTPTPPRCF